MVRLSVMGHCGAGRERRHPSMASAVKAAELVQLAKGEKLVALVPLNTVLAMATAGGIIKRVNPDYPLNQTEWDIMKLKDGDEIVAATPCPTDDAVLTFVTRDAKLLTFDAAKVRPQDAPAAVSPALGSPRATA